MKNLDRSVEEAPADALIKIEIPTNGSFLTTTNYHFKCPSAGMAFVKNPVVLSSKNKSGIVQKLSGM